MAEVEFQFHVAATKVSSPFTTALSHLSNTRLRIRIPERQCDQVLRAIGQGNGQISHSLEIDEVFPLRLSRNCAAE